MEIRELVACTVAVSVVGVRSFEPVAVAPELDVFEHPDPVHCRAIGKVAGEQLPGEDLALLFWRCPETDFAVLRAIRVFAPLRESLCRGRTTRAAITAPRVYTRGC